MFTITKQLRKFSAAHRLVKNYVGRCKHLHGHDYKVEVTIAAKQLNQYDFVMDFDEIKQLFDRWLQDHWDHATLVSEIDTPLIDFLEKQQQHYFIIPGNKNTTAECLAEFLFQQFNQLLKTVDNQRITLHTVRVFESDSAWASYSLSN